MATPRKRKNTADSGSMKINKFFKPIKNTVIPLESNNDENLPPQGGQPAEKKRAFGKQSLNKKPVKAPLRDRNPEVRISASLTNQSNRVFSVLKDDDIKNGVMKMPQFERKEPSVIQSSSQPESTHSSQSSYSQKDDFMSKIKPRKLFSVYNDNQEEKEQSDSKQEEEDDLTKEKPFSVFMDDDQSSQTSCSQQEKTVPRQRGFSVFMDNAEDDQSSQTSLSQQEKTVLKERPFSVFMDDDQSSQTSLSQQEKTVLKERPFSVFMDNTQDDDQTNCLAQGETVFKQKPFSIFMDDDDQDDQSSCSQQERDTAVKETPFSIFMDNEQDEFSQTTHSQHEDTAPQRKPFSVLIDNTNDEQSQLNLQEKHAPKKKLFSVFMDDNSENDTYVNDSQREEGAPKKKFFSIFKDDNSDDELSQLDDSQRGTANNRLSVFNEDSQKENVQPEKTVYKNTKSTKKHFSVYNDENQPASEGFTIFRDEESDKEPVMEQSKICVLGDKTKDTTSENKHPDDFWDEEDDEDDLNTFLIHTKRDEPQEHDFFSDDGDSDSYSEVQLLHNDTFSTTFDPVSIEEANNSVASQETNDTSPSHSLPEGDPLLEAGTLEMLNPVLAEEVHVAYPNPRGESLNDKLGLSDN
ncbi:hypothetical protein K501DRAFT_283499 [Backusella circina FSU 941]|nr:hypothetical protein K501DRAFT_283499 [Backusella circina FSU 941]